MPWQSSSINPAVTTPAADISKLTNDLSVLRGMLNGTNDASAFPNGAVIPANVGIGASPPASKLDVRVSGATTTLDGLNLNNGTAGAIFQLSGATYSYRGVGANNLWVGTNSGHDMYIGPSTANVLKFGSGAFEYMRLDSAGRLLLGTTSVLGSALLSVAGKTQADTSIAGDVIANFNNSSATGFGLRVGGGASGAGYALSVNNAAGTELMQVNGAGDVRLRTDGGAAGFYTGPTNAEAYFRYNSDGTTTINGRNGYAMLFASGGTERARIASTGRFTTSFAANGAVTALTYGATITPDFNAANNFSVTLTGGATLANPSNLTAGQSGVIVITQDATGGRTLAYGSNWKFPGGAAPSLTTTANAVDVLAYYVESSTRITARLISDVK